MSPQPKPKSAEIRKFIVDHVETHPRDIAKMTAEKFGVTRQAVNRHLTTLVEDEVLEARGRTRERTYELKKTSYHYLLSLAENQEEDKVWRTYVQPHLAHLAENVVNICYYGFTEIFNNAIDHSEGTTAEIYLRLSAKNIDMKVKDNGVGIFEKIKARKGLDDYRQVILELSKGKLTTDPTRHSGQGIFFTSRMMDTFMVAANNVLFGHVSGSDDWLIEQEQPSSVGTSVDLVIAADTTTTAREVFDRYSDRESDDYDFSRTHVPLSLAKYGKDQLVSRSQAKRVVARFDRFKEVCLDFKGIDEIGQAFADEIFRVYASQHPEVEIVARNATAEVVQMIRRAQNAKARDENEASPESC